jgi:hypothetical protein
MIWLSPVSVVPTGPKATTAEPSSKGRGLSEATTVVANHHTKPAPIFRWRSAARQPEKMHAASFGHLAASLPRSVN